MSKNSTEKKLNQIYEIIQGIADLPQLLKDLEGELVPYNIIVKIERMMDTFPVYLSAKARALRDEMEKMGYPK